MPNAECRFAMPIEITMPRLSDTMEAGTVIKWNVQEGDEVSSGQAIADIETDKATMEMQVYDDGTVATLLVGEGDQVPVGSVIALLAEEGEDVADVKSTASKSGGPKKTARAGSGEKSEDETKTERATATASREEEDQVNDVDDADASKSDATAARRRTDQPKASPGTPAVSRASDRASDATSNGSRLFITPVARRIADEHEIDIKSIEGTGPNGRIIKRDVLNFLEKGESARGRAVEPTRATPQAAGFEPGDKPLSNMRQTIARRLVQSKTTIPHYQVTFTFNMDPLLDLRKTLNEQLEAQGVRLSVNDFLVRACALASHQHPEFNATWGEDHITVLPNVNIGVAVALPREKGGGLVVATIRNADQKGLRLISEETKTLAEKARTRGLTIEEMADSTFTISNLGMFGVEHFTAIINPPNAAILAVGGAQEKPVVRNGQIVIGHEMQATLSLDHRIIDGAMAAQYLQTLKQMIENPATLLV